MPSFVTAPAAAAFGAKAGPLADLLSAAAPPSCAAGRDAHGTQRAFSSGGGEPSAPPPEEAAVTHGSWQGSRLPRRLVVVQPRHRGEADLQEALRLATSLTGTHCELVVLGGSKLRSRPSRTHYFGRGNLAWLKAWLKGESGRQQHRQQQRQQQEQQQEQERRRPGAPVAETAAHDWQESRRGQGAASAAALEGGGAVAGEDATTPLFVNAVLTPLQERNMEAALGRPVMDRVGLIIAIFAARAHTREARLQVELASLEYQLPRLVRVMTAAGQRGGFGGLALGGAAGGATLQVVSARQRGSSGAGGLGGGGGSGDPELRLQRYRIVQRCKVIRTQLAAVAGQRGVQREGRAAAGVPTVAVVGYTNVGKTSLMAGLCGPGSGLPPGADKLFATLDPALRRVWLPGVCRHVVLSDTVGFIRDLPVGLVAAFRATLEEVACADALLLVVDASAEDAGAQRAAVLRVLAQLGVPHDVLVRRTVEVWNKVDAAMMQDERAAMLQQREDERTRQWQEREQRRQQRAEEAAGHHTNGYSSSTLQLRVEQDSGSGSDWSSEADEDEGTNAAGWHTDSFVGADAGTSTGKQRSTGYGHGRFAGQQQQQQQQHGAAVTPPSVTTLVPPASEWDGTAWERDMGTWLAGQGAQAARAGSGGGGEATTALAPPAPGDGSSGGGGGSRLGGRSRQGLSQQQQHEPPARRLFVDAPRPPSAAGRPPRNGDVLCNTLPSPPLHLHKGQGGGTRSSAADAGAVAGGARATGSRHLPMGRRRPSLRPAPSQMVTGVTSYCGADSPKLDPGDDQQRRQFHQGPSVLAGGDDTAGCRDVGQGQILAGADALPYHPQPQPGQWRRQREGSRQEEDEHLQLQEQVFAARLFLEGGQQQFAEADQQEEEASASGSAKPLPPQLKRRLAEARWLAAEVHAAADGPQPAEVVFASARYGLGLLEVKQALEAVLWPHAVARPAAGSEDNSAGRKQQQQLDRSPSGAPEDTTLAPHNAAVALEDGRPLPAAAHAAPIAARETLPAAASPSRGADMELEQLIRSLRRRSKPQ